MHQLAASGAVAADISSYRSSKAVEAEIVTGGGELINDLDRGTVTLEDLKPEDLPAPLQALSPEEQKAVIAEKSAERAALRGEIDKLVQAREAYIAEKLASDSPGDSFDKAVEEMVHEQGAAKGILY